MQYSQLLVIETATYINSLVSGSSEPFFITCCKEFHVRSKVSGSFAIVFQKFGIFFIFLPKTELTVLLFACVLGILWLSTVPLTSGIITVVFGPHYMSMLYGIAFFSHLIGSFLGSWLGGRLFDAYGSYDIVWWISVALGFIAALMHMPIKEKAVQRFANQQI